MKHYSYLLLVFVMYSCTKQLSLEPISNKDFMSFVDDTGYITDAEKYGWSIVQRNILQFETIEGANWRTPNGQDSVPSDHPVTQVSYNDAMAYCQWANKRLPNYNEYWQFTLQDKRKINTNSIQIVPISNTNIIGNTWDITSTQNFENEIRLAGGSYLCDTKTCNGSERNRELFVSKDTGNSHISFSVANR